MKSSRGSYGLITAFLLTLLIGVPLAVGSLAKSKNAGGGMTYAKYGCIPKDPTLRDWSQPMGLSTCE